MTPKRDYSDVHVLFDNKKAMAFLQPFFFLENEMNGDILEYRLSGF